ncbi:hypothetical protein I7I51_03798 [Histoplasma capsulatum]|uniref:DUF7729 domain-containing protein n=1 Tax=Ajellomyces capsulatus TaxID=5037 RepID=A0A8A1M6L5_AJECA|nr:hypothetical protein I7I51_03798 [Histoplasma capsulatum]
MSELDRKLVSEDICGKDLKLEQPIVIQAHNGLRSYGTVHDATCLKNPDTDNYCFSDAITNTSNPANSYVYFLPLNMALPGSSRPTCNKCLQATMQTFSLAATNDNQPISKTYLAAAQQINIGCGPSFVVAAVKLGSPNVARRTVQLGTGPSMFGFDLIGGDPFILALSIHGSSDAFILKSKIFALINRPEVTPIERATSPASRFHEWSFSYS